MDAGAVVAIVFGGVTAVGTVYGFVTVKFTELKRKIEKLEMAADADEKTIALQQRQLDKYEITAQLQDKFFSGLTPPTRRERRGDSG